MRNILTNPATLGVLRHVLTTAGGFLVANGTLEASELEQAVGAIVVIAGIAWSILEKRVR
ncbi:MAG: hypothetical protein ACK4OP_00145 [Gemmobacter sp.]